MAPQGSLPLSRPHWSSAFWDDRQKCHFRDSSRRISVSVVLEHLSVANGAIEAGGLLTRESIVREVANKSLLVEDGAVATEEAPLGGAGHHPVVVLDGQADVEDLGENKFKIRWEI